MSHPGAPPFIFLRLWFIVILKIIFVFALKKSFQLFGLFRKQQKNTCLPMGLFMVSPA